MKADARKRYLSFAVWVLDNLLSLAQADGRNILVFNMNDFLNRVKIEIQDTESLAGLEEYEVNRGRWVEELSEALTWDIPGIRRNYVLFQLEQNEYGLIDRDYVQRHAYRALL